MKCTNRFFSSSALSDRKYFKSNIWIITLNELKNLLKSQKKSQCRWSTPFHMYATSEKYFSFLLFLWKKILFLYCVLYVEIKFINSEKATKIFEIITLLLTVCTVVKSKGKISQNFCGLLRIYELSLTFKRPLESPT